MDGLGVEFFSCAALRGQQDRRIRGRRPLGQRFHGPYIFPHSHNGIKGIPCGVGPVHPVQHLFVPLFIGLQLRAEVIGVPDKRDHRQPAGYCAVQKDRVHIDKIDVIVLLRAGRMENRLSRCEHLWQPRPRADLPQGAAHNLIRRLLYKIQIGLIGKDNSGLRVDHENSLPHGLEGGAQFLVKGHSGTCFLSE